MASLRNSCRFPLPMAWVILAWCCAGSACRKPAPPPAPAPAVDTAAAAMNRGVSLMGQYQYDQAAAAFQEVVRSQPDSTDAKVNLAIALFNRGRKETADIDRATNLLAQVLAAQPGHLQATYFSGIIHQHLGQTESAVACFQQVVQQRPADGAAWYLLGLCKDRLGQPAVAELRKALEFKPYLYSAYYKLFQIASRQEKENEARQYLDQFTALRENPLGESIELPQYNQMGELARVRPMAAASAATPSPRQYQAAESTTAMELDGPTHALAPHRIPGGLALGDLNGDGQPDLIVLPGSGTPGGPVRIGLNVGRGFRDQTASSGLGQITDALACAVGDYDNDDRPDLLIAGAQAIQLWHGNGDGTFTNATTAAGLGSSPPAPRVSALFLDLDHDADLDLLECAAALPDGRPAGNELWKNNNDGTFTPVAASAGLACPEGGSLLALPGDFDGDRDLDLVVLREGAPARLFRNELLARFTEFTNTVPIRGDCGGVLQDFNGDGQLDLFVLGGDPVAPSLLLGDGHGLFQAGPTFAEAAQATLASGPWRALRAADIDLDGDLDVALFGSQGCVLLNDGQGRFAMRESVWKTPADRCAGLELIDVNGDFVPDLIELLAGDRGQVRIAHGVLTPPSTALALQPTGMRGRDKRTRSPASGYGTLLTARTGLRQQRLLYTGLSGGPNQSWVPAVFGLDGAAAADYVDLLWPDGVGQMDMALASGQRHIASEVQRRLSSCPVLFAWNGERFAFVTDFAGVGGLGYFVSPGQYAPPQVLEHVKLEPHQLQAHDGRYELRVTEPMEETAYVDRLELVAVDHPASQAVFPDERLALSGPAPTHELLVVEAPIFPQRARAPGGVECTENLARVDRIYAYRPELDRRYLGFCRRHTLELDFGSRLAHFGPSDRVFLFVHGSIEFPYSQTVYAAAQSRVGWEPIRVERRSADGGWATVVPDGGAPGGMARMFTIELTGQVSGTDCMLRLTSNLELSYDQVFVARHAAAAPVAQHSVPLLAAELRRAGFPREVSPDGRAPLIYDYDQRDLTAPFHVLRGAYTRHGRVDALLAHFDDQYVLVGPGDEIALQFDAARLPPVAAGRQRSFLLVSHAYCKDMDLYTATPQTLEPLPFRGMSRYPYPATERYPDTPEHQAFLKQYNTRQVR